MMAAGYMMIAGSMMAAALLAKGNHLVCMFLRQYLSHSVRYFQFTMLGFLLGALLKKPKKSQAPVYMHYHGGYGGHGHGQYGGYGQYSDAVTIWGIRAKKKLRTNVNTPATA